MDTIATDSVPTGIVGLESNAGNPSGNVAEREQITGAIDPDTARAFGTESADSSDFAASFADPLASTGPRVRRTYTRRKQSGAGQDATVKSKSSKLDWIEKAIFGIHEVLGTALAPELKLDHEDSKGIADAIEGIQDAYGIPKLDPKTEALMNLGTVLAGIYGTRAVAIYIRKTTEKPRTAPQQQHTDNVHNIRPAADPAPPRPQPSTGAPFDPGKIIDR